MEDLLISLLQTICSEVGRQGSYTVDEYPDRFLTYWERPSYDGSHYDNEAVSCVYEYDINFYSIDPSEPYDYIKRAKKLLKENGFILSGNGYGTYSGVQSHTGRGIAATYLEREV